MIDGLLRRGGPLVALAVIASIAIAAPVIGQSSSTSSAIDPSAPASASSASAPAAAMNDDDRIAAGKHIWQDAACYNCHGTNGQGGHSPDFPAGPNLRTSGVDPDTMLMMVECGIPSTRMPAWLKGAYTDIACYGNPLGPAPASTLVSGVYTEAELKTLIDYIQTNFMKQPIPTWSAQ